MLDTGTHRVNSVSIPTQPRDPQHPTSVQRIQLSPVTSILSPTSGTGRCCPAHFHTESWSPVTAGPRGLVDVDMHTEVRWGLLTLSSAVCPTRSQPRHQRQAQCFPHAARHCKDFPVPVTRTDFDHPARPRWTQISEL